MGVEVTISVTIAPLTVTTSREVTGVGVHDDGGGGSVGLEVGSGAAVSVTVEGGGMDEELGVVEVVELGCGVELVD